MAISALPTIPLVVFGIIEPALLLWAYKIAWFEAPFDYFQAQVPAHALTEATHFTPQAYGVTLLLANVFLLLALLAVVCSFTTNAGVIRGYLLSVAIADWGHIYACYLMLGPEYFWDYQGWGETVRGNIGVSAVLNVLRLATVLGVFGSIGVKAKGKGKTA